MARTERRTAASDAYAIAWRLHEVTESSMQAFNAIAGRHGLTAPQARCVLRLYEPSPMHALADHLNCYRSNITGIADRLRDRGLIATTTGTDRRVKLLELTRRGAEIRRRLEAQIAADAPSISRLTARERRDLIALLDKLVQRPTQPPG